MRIRSIEFWRLLFAISIVLCHSMFLPTNKNGVNLHVNSLGVEFFFILSGFLMARSVCNKKEPCVALGRETAVFLAKKIKPIYTIFLIAAIFEISARIFLRSAPITGLVWNLWDLLFLRAFGFGGRQDLLVGASWFLFALFPAMCILYPLLRKYTDMFLHIIAPLVAFFILGWFSRTYGHINFALHVTENKIICLGLLRAIAEVCAGCAAYLLCDKLKQMFSENTMEEEGRKEGTLCITLLEIVPFIAVILFAIYGSRSQTDFLCVLLICIGIIAAFSGKSYTNKALSKIDDNFISVVSKYSVCLYLNHYVWLRTLQDWKLDVSFLAEISIYIALSALTAWFCLILIKYVDMFLSYIGSKFVEL